MINLLLHTARYFLRIQVDSQVQVNSLQPDHEEEGEAGGGGGGVRGEEVNWCLSFS